MEIPNISIPEIQSINVPIFVCDELYKFGITDTHLGLNGNKIVKDSIIRKMQEK